MLAALSSIWEKARVATGRFSRQEVEEVRKQAQKEEKITPQTILKAINGFETPLRVILMVAGNQDYSAVLDLCDKRFENKILLQAASVILLEDDEPLAHLVRPSFSRLYGQKFTQYGIVIPTEINLGEDFGSTIFFIHIHLDHNDPEKLMIKVEWEDKTRQGKWPDEQRTMREVLRRVLKVIDSLKSLLRSQRAVSLAA